MNTLEQQTERFQNLPSDFQKALSTFDYDHRLNLIQKKHKLHIDQAVSLEKIMSDIIFGDIKSLELTNEIERKLNLNRESAVEMALDINEAILAPMREHIKEIQNSQ